MRTLRILDLDQTGISFYHNLADVLVRQDICVKKDGHYYITRSYFNTVDPLELNRIALACWPDHPFEIIEDL